MSILYRKKLLAAMHKSGVQVEHYRRASTCGSQSPCNTETLLKPSPSISKTSNGVRHSSTPLLPRSSAESEHVKRISSAIVVKSENVQEHNENGDVKEKNKNKLEDLEMDDFDLLEDDIENTTDKSSSSSGKKKNSRSSSRSKRA